MANNYRLILDVTAKGNEPHAAFCDMHIVWQSENKLLFTSFDRWQRIAYPPSKLLLKEAMHKVRQLNKQETRPCTNT